MLSSLFPANDQLARRAVSAPVLLQAQLAQREEELAQAQFHLARMEREVAARDQRLTALSAQVAQQTHTIAAYAAEIARLRALLGDAGAPPVLPMPGVQDVVDRLVKHAEKSYATRPRTAITHLCVHHSAAAATVPVEHIAQYHVEQQGWPGIGYHYYVKPDGVIYLTQRLETVSWHVTHNNDYSVGVCVSGDFTYDPPPAAQIATAAALIAWLLQSLGIPVAHVMGHKEFPQNDTSCPGETWLRSPHRWKDSLLNAITAVQNSTP
ncbi:MAG: N-acetylmuramoyl-L-alanine amidase [Caldilineales bacterium]